MLVMTCIAELISLLPFLNFSRCEAWAVRETGDMLKKLWQRVVFCISVFRLWSAEHIVTMLDICIHRGHHHRDSFTVCIRRWHKIMTGGQITCVWPVVQLFSSTVATTEKTFCSTLGNIRAVSTGDPVKERQSADPDKWDYDGDCCTNEQEIEFSPRLSLHPPDKTVLKCYNK